MKVMRINNYTGGPSLWVRFDLNADGKIPLGEIAQAMPVIMDNAASSFEVHIPHLEHTKGDRG